MKLLLFSFVVTDYIRSTHTPKAHGNYHLVVVSRTIDAQCLQARTLLAPTTCCTVSYSTEIVGNYHQKRNHSSAHFQLHCSLLCFFAFSAKLPPHHTEFIIHNNNKTITTIYKRSIGYARIRYFCGQSGNIFAPALHAHLLLASIFFRPFCSNNKWN